MLIYFIAFAVILGLAYPLCIHKPSNKKRAAYVIVVFSALYLVAVCRYSIGSDFYNYYRIFDKIANADGMAIFNCEVEPAYALLNKLLSLFTDNINVLYAVCEVIILVPIAYVFYKYSKMLWLSCFFYMCLTFFYTTMNFTRQSIAASIVFLSFIFIKKKKIIPAILIALLAATFHVTALIFIPLYLLSLIKPGKLSFAIYGAGTVLLYLFSNQLINLALDVASSVLMKRYADYKDSIYFSVGLSWIYVIVPLAILAIAIAAYYTGWGKKEKLAPFYVNFMMFSAIIWLFITKHMILERLSMYIYIFTLLALPSIAGHYLCGDNSEETADVTETAETTEAAEEAKPAKLIGRRGVCLTVTVVFLAGCFAYNLWGMYNQNFHNIFPYVTAFPSIQTWSDSFVDKDDADLMLAAERDGYRYLCLLNNPRYTYVITVNSSKKTELDAVTSRTMRELGLSGSIDGNYIAVSDGGKISYEQSGSERLTYDTTICTREANITSSDKEAYVIIGDKSYTLGNSQLNIVVFKSGNGEFVDSVNLYTKDKKLIATRLTEENKQ